MEGHKHATHSFDSPLSEDNSDLVLFLRDSEAESALGGRLCGHVSSQILSSSFSICKKDASMHIH